MVDSSTTARPILGLLLGHRWVQCQLHPGIRYVSGASILIKSLSTLGVVLGRLRGDAGDLSTRWQIPLQQLHRFGIRHLDVAGLDASHTPV